MVAGDNLSTNTSGSGTAGVYYAGKYTGGALDAPTSITLDAQGNPQAVFVFVSSSTTKLESGASVILANGAQAGNVYWVVGSSFTSVWNGIQSNMVGNILASSSVTLGGGNLNGRALASTGAVTLATTEIITWPVLSLIPGTPGTPAVPGIPAVQQVTNVVINASNRLHLRTQGPHGSARRTQESTTMRRWLRSRSMILTRTLGQCVELLLDNVWLTSRCPSH